MLYLSDAYACTLHFIGGGVTGLIANQTSFTTEITWTPLSPAPLNGYQTSIFGDGIGLIAPRVDISAPQSQKLESSLFH